MLTMLILGCAERRRDAAPHLVGDSPPQRMSLSNRLWVSLMFGFSITISPAAHGDDPLIQRFIDEAESAWVEYVEQQKPLNQFTIKMKIDRSQKAFTYEYGLSMSIINSGNEYVEEELRWQKFGGPSPPQQPDPPKGWVASGQNNDYMFRVLQVGDQDYWSILGVKAPEDVSERTNHLGDVQMRQIRLIDFGPSKGYLYPVAASHDDQTGHVAIEFEFKKSKYRRPNGTDLDLTDLSDWKLTFDPSRFWLPISGSYFRDDEPPYTLSTKWEYAQSSEGLMYRSKTIESESWDEEGAFAIVVTDIQAESVDVDESRFRLPYYGLPEPEMGSRNHWLVVLALFGGLFLLGCGFLLRTSLRSPSC